MLIFSYFLVPQTSGCSQRSAGTPRLCHHSRHLQAKIRPQGKQNMAGKSTIYWREVSIQVSRWEFQWCLIAEGYINQAGIHMDDIDWNSIYYYCSQPEIEGFWSGPLNYTALWHGGDVIRNDWGLSNYSYKGKTRSLDLIDIMSIYLSACLSVYLSIYPSISCTFEQKTVVSGFGPTWLWSWQSLWHFMNYQDLHGDFHGFGRLPLPLSSHGNHKWLVPDRWNPS